MNISKLRIIIAREYLNKVKKKSFLLITFLAPVLFAGLCLLPSLIMVLAKEEPKQIGIIDYTAYVAPQLSDTDNIKYHDLGPLSLLEEGAAAPTADTLRSVLARYAVDALITIVPVDSVGVVASAYSEKDLGMESSGVIQGAINDAIEQHRIEQFNAANPGLDLAQAMQEVRSNVQLIPLLISKDGSVAFSESGIKSILSMVLGLALYMFIVMFCAMVMSSVIEEKSSRVVEVLISSVKATELMFGKIIGVAMVALTQFLLWILLTLALLAVAGAIMGFGNLFGSVMDPTGLAAGADMSQMGMILSTLGQVNYTGLLVCFFFYFVFGYLLYASIFAAIGSAVENEADTQQLQIPVTIPLMIGMFISIYTMKAPESAIVYWGSMIPFTSPIVMLSRIPFNPPVTDIVISLIVLVLTFVLFAWLSAKIYKVGVLMFGKKSSFKDLLNWMKQKN